LVVVFAATVPYICHWLAVAKLDYFGDANVVGTVILVCAINLSLFTFVQSSLAYHMLTSSHIYWQSGPRKGLRFMSSYLMMALLMFALLKYLPGEADTIPGALFNHCAFRTMTFIMMCLILALNSVDIGAFGTPFALVLAFIGSQYGADWLYMTFFFAFSLYHQLSLRATQFDVYVFGILGPLCVGIPLMVFWIDMTAEALCYFMLPVHMWAATMTFPAAFVWFHFSGFLSQSFHTLFSDSLFLSVLHNAYGPTAMPLRLFVPLQIFAFAMVAFLSSATCGALNLVSTSDFVISASIIILGLTLFVARWTQDIFSPDNEDVI